MRRLILLAASIPLLAVGVLAANDSKTSHAKKSGDPFLSGDPFTLDQVVMLLKQDAIPIKRRKAAIESRGVAFPLTGDALSKLESAGASDDILGVIRSKAQPAPVAAAAPPKPVAKGMLSVTCAPAECQVSLNGTSVGATSGGKLEMA